MYDGEIPISLLADFELHYAVKKIHVHRWPMDSSVWDDSVKKELDDSINKNPNKKTVIVKENEIRIENFKFESLKKIGITVPFFKKECTLIFEGKFESFFAHAHVTIKSENYVDIFTELTSWKNRFFSNDS